MDEICKSEEIEALEKSFEEQLEKDMPYEYSGDEQERFAQNQGKMVNAAAGRGDQVTSRKINQIHGENLYHHTWFDGEDHHHVISRSPDRPMKSNKADTLAHMTMSDVERAGEPVMTVHTSAVRPRSRGQGIGKMLYSLAAAHHGDIESDELVSPQATNVYHSLSGMGGANNMTVHIGQHGNSDDPHSISYNGPQLKNEVDYHPETGITGTKQTNWQLLLPKKPPRATPNYKQNPEMEASPIDPRSQKQMNLFGKSEPLDKMMQVGHAGGPCAVAFQALDTGGVKPTLAKDAPRSPKKGDTIKQLEALQASGYHNPDTGTELQPEEADDHLHRLRENKANKQVKTQLKVMQGGKKEEKPKSSESDWMSLMAKSQAALREVTLRLTKSKLAKASKMLSDLIKADLDDTE